MKLLNTKVHAWSTSGIENARPAEIQRLATKIVLAQSLQNYTKVQTKPFSILHYLGLGLLLSKAG